MTTRSDYYRILQVHPGAEKEVIDAAYRRLASKYHPDVNQATDAAERMKQLNTAYEVLSDSAKRAAYDASRDGVPSRDMPPHDTVRSRYSGKAWRTLLIGAVILLLAAVAFRLGPALLLLVPKLVVSLVVISLVVWLLFTLLKPRH